MYRSQSITLVAGGAGDSLTGREFSESLDGFNAGRARLKKHFLCTDRIVKQNKLSARSELAAARWSLRRVFFIAGGHGETLNRLHAL